MASSSGSLSAENITKDAWTFLQNSKVTMSKYDRLAGAPEQWEDIKIDPRELRNSLNVVFPGVALQEVEYVLGVGKAGEDNTSLAQIASSVAPAISTLTDEALEEFFDSLQEDGRVDARKVQSKFSEFGMTNLSEAVMWKVWKRLLEDAGTPSSDWNKGITMDVFKQIMNST